MRSSKTLGHEELSGILKRYPNINANSISSFDLKPFLLAYAKYKDTLRETKIVLKYKFMTEDSMQSQYTADFLFVNNHSRTYIMYITNNKDANIGQVFDDMTIDEKTGWFGHELSHIVQYENKSRRRLLGFTAAYGLNWLISSHPKFDMLLSHIPLFKHLGSRYLKGIEQSVDNETIRRGLGYELARGTDYTINSSNIPRHIQKRYSDIYTPVHENMNKTSKEYFNKLNSPRIHSK